MNPDKCLLPISKLVNKAVLIASSASFALTAIFLREDRIKCPPRTNEATAVGENSNLPRCLLLAEPTPPRSLPPVTMGALH